MERHILDSSQLIEKSLDDVCDLIRERIQKSYRLGDISVRSLSCLSISGDEPVGIYILADDAGSINYVGKTHGRSFHERMVSHLDSREPKPGSPHLAQLVSTMVKKNSSLSRTNAVEKILNMRVLWLPIPSGKMRPSRHKELIALVERRLLWKHALNPHYNSCRVKENDVITIRGKRRVLSERSGIFDLIEQQHAQ